MSLPFLNALEETVTSVEHMMKEHGYRVYMRDDCGDPYGEYYYADNQFHFDLDGSCDKYKDSLTGPPKCIEWAFEPVTIDFPDFQAMLLYAAFHNVEWG